MKDRIRQSWNRVRAFFRRGALDQELDAEMASHLDMAIEDNLRTGMTPEEARRRALAHFGGLQQARERQRAARGLPFLDVLGQDLRFTFRTLRRDLAFTIVAVLILALGIAANVAVFSVVDAILVRPLPFRNPERLVRVAPLIATCGESCRTYTTDATEEFQQRNRSFEQVTGYFAFTSADNFKLMGRPVPLPVTGILVMQNFFQTLGVQPMLGRLFTPEECLHKSRPVTVLSYAFWKTQFGADRGVIGKAIDLNGTPVTVIGVLPETFDFGSVFSPGAKVDLFAPFIMYDFRDDGNDLALMGRLRPGVTLAQAQSEADQLFPKLDADLRHPEWKANYTGHLVFMKDYVSGRMRRSLIVLWCAVGLMLLIVCVNLSNLLLARASARSGELAMRHALGAGRTRLIRQLLTESLLLSATGAALGLAMAWVVTSFLAHQTSFALPLLLRVRIDGAAVLWTVAVAVLSAVAFGLIPALRSCSGDLAEALRDAGRGASEGRKHDALRSTLVIAEVALACVLVVGAGLLLRSFVHLLSVDLGFEPAHAAAIAVDDGSPQNTAERAARWREVIEQVQTIPGVEIAGISDNVPLSRNRSWGISAKGRQYRPGELQGTFVYIVSPGYLKAMGLRLIEGRDFRWSDDSKSQNGVVINETVARSLWPGEHAVGQMANAGGVDVRVIGVVADVRESSVESKGGWQMYLPVTNANFGPEGTELVVRSNLPPGALAVSVMRILRSINPAQPATDFRPIQQIVDHATSPRRFLTLLVSIFAALGLTLAALGIYGVIAYTVTRRTQEIGIRMALGASRGRVQRSVLLRTMRLVAIGLVMGSVVSFAVSRAIVSLLFGTQPNDAVTYAGMAVLLLGVALLAGYLPARRAARIDPIIALRTN